MLFCWVYTSSHFQEAKGAENGLSLLIHQFGISRGFNNDSIWLIIKGGFRDFFCSRSWCLVCLKICRENLLCGFNFEKTCFVAEKRIPLDAVGKWSLELFCLEDGISISHNGLLKLGLWWHFAAMLFCIKGTKLGWGSLWHCVYSGGSKIVFSFLENAFFQSELHLHKMIIFRFSVLLKDT